MKKVLVVTSSFAPTATPGVYRTVKFVKYLPRFGWEPHVLRVHAKRSGARDQSLLDDVPRGTKVHVVRDHGLHVLTSVSAGLCGRPLLRSDHGYFLAALKAGKRIVTEEGIDAVFLSAPPDRLPVLGLWLKSATGLPLIVDFRDPPWHLNSQWKPPEKERRAFDRYAHEVYEKADFVIANTEPVRAQLIEKFNLPREKVMTITNGYDEEDFAGLDSEVTPARPHMEFFHPGSLRTGPETSAFLDAVGEFLKELPEARGKVRFVFTGTKTSRYRKLVSERSLDDVVTMEPHCPHREAVRRMVRADMLLVIFKVETSAMRIPQKVFEYLRAGRPVLALIGRGPATEILDSFRAGTWNEPADVRKTAESLVSFYRDWQSDKLSRVVRDSSEIRRFRRDVLAEQLARILDRVST